MNPDLDHIILGCRDLEEGIAYVEKLSGYRAAFGGSHSGRGTRNALLKIGQKSYLEILAPDPGENGLEWHKNIVELREPRLIGWAVRASKLEDLAASFRQRGIPVIGPSAGSRTMPNGDVLGWTTLLRLNDREGTLPFYIEWDATSKHPAHNAPGQCLLLEFHDAGQRSGELQLQFGNEILEFPRAHEATPQLRALIRGQKGEFVLNSSQFRAALNSPLF